MERLAEELGERNAELVRPHPGIPSIVAIDTETQHRHTFTVSCMTLYDKRSTDTRHGPRRAAGSKVARDVAVTVTSPMPKIGTERATVTTTVLVFHERSMGHRHVTNLAPFAEASLAASCAGDPVAPNGRNVTGAAASAAASAAPAAFV